MNQITRNAIQCVRCECTLVSTHRHHMVVCACDPPVGVDGGHEYLRRIGDPGHYRELSEYASHGD